MAVYTHLTNAQISTYIAPFNLGDLLGFKGISGGIENTNYYLLVEDKKYILTIYEKRVNSEDLPFF